MKCDELKDRWFNAYPEIMGIEGGEPTKCYGKADVDAAIAELKAALKESDDARYEAGADAADYYQENRRLKRALWLARAKEAWSNARWFNLCNPDYVRNRQGFTPNNENQKQMDSIEWARLFYNNYKKLIAKAEEYK